MKNKCPRGYCRVGAKGFKIVIRSYGGVWAQEKDVYFTQMASTYSQLLAALPGKITE